jgi:hypothetical protein
MATYLIDFIMDCIRICIMIMTTELYERMNKLCDARVMFDDEQRELEQAVYDAIVAVNKAEE